LGLLVAGCGSSHHSAAGSTATAKHEAQGAIGNVTPPPPPAADVTPDPDSANMAGADLDWVVDQAGKDRYQLYLQNTSRVGYVDSITWRAPPGESVVAVEGTTVGHCQVSGGTIVCSGLHLKPPTCACRPGGAATVTFVLRQNNPNLGFQGAGLEINTMTPVLNNIPSAAGQKSNGE
jgi:hypothetical protein